MKFTDLTKEQQEHFLGVVNFYGDGFPEDAEYVDFDLGALLKEPWDGCPYIWNNNYRVWEVDENPTTNHYPVPDKPWYDPKDVAFKPKSRIDLIGQNGNDGEHYKDQDKGDMVNKPNHYQILPDYEVKDVLKAVLDKIEDSDFDMSLYEAGWYQQSMQYFLRFHGKNGLEDLEKGVQTMQFVINSIKQRKEF